jgi:cytochrome c
MITTFYGKVILNEDFKKIDTGYKIITEKCPLCHQAGGAHKMSCSTQKIQINL